MAAEWYYGRGGQQHGPITAKQLKELAQNGELHPSDLVWKEGMDGWKPASSVKGLLAPQAAQGAAPPPLPPTSSQPSPASSVRSSSGGLVGRFFGMMSASTFTGRWILKDDPKTWIEFSISGNALRPEYVFTRSNGDIGKWELVEKGKSIIITMTGKPAEQMTVLRHENKLMSAFLDVQDENGVVLRFKKGKTEAGQAVAKFFGVNRAELLVAVWREANDPEKWCQFTDDGAFVAGDGAAGRYTFSGEQPDETVAIQLTDGTTRTWKVVSLTNGQLVVAEDGKATTFRKQGRTAGGQRGSAADSSDPAPGLQNDGGSPGEFGKAWSWLTKLKCPKCGQRAGEKTRTNVLDRRQEVGSWMENGRIIQKVLNITTYEKECKCSSCGHSWSYTETNKYPA